jgi:hypothetical protein
VINRVEGINKIIFTSGVYYVENLYTGEYFVEIDLKKLLCKYTFNSSFYNNEVKWKISKRHYLKFLEELMNINIFSWNNNYTDNDVADGSYWLLKFVYSKNELFEIKGSNAYPENYGDFIDALEKYFPIIPMDREYRIKLRKMKSF